MPEVTVITTAYNAERYLGAAIESVLAQRGIEAEHVVVDDGSTDGTRGVAASLADSRVRLIEAGRVGRGRALNIAIAESRAPLVAVLDADDLAHPDRLRVEADVLGARADAVLVGSGQLLIGETPPDRWPDVAGHAVADVRASLPIYNPLSHSSVMIRKTALDAVGGYDAGRRALYDWDLYVRLAAAGGTLLKVNRPLVAKRIHETQFFEGRRQMRYAMECFGLQWRSLRDLRRSRLLAGLFPLLAAYRMAPRPMRLAARKAVGAVRGLTR